MLLPASPFLSAAIDWLGHGLWDLTWWQVVLYTLATTHVTIAAVTIFLHRTQTHRAMDLSPIPSHFFRFWLWIGTGMVTKEWVAIHRKHHAKCETEEDPHSPQVKGINEVALARRRALSSGIEEQRNVGALRPRHAGRLARTQPLFALQLARRGFDAGDQSGALWRPRPRRVGRPDALDPGHRGWHHQRHRPLLGATATLRRLTPAAISHRGA